MAPLAEARSPDRSRHRRSPQRAPRILLTGQNTQEAAALVAIAEQLAATVPDLEYEFLTQDALYGQDVGTYLEREGHPLRELEPAVRFEKIWPRAPLWKRLAFLLSAPASAAGLAAEYDAIISGSESLATWMLLSEAEERGIPSFRVCVSYLESGSLPQGGWRLQLKGAAKTLLSLVPRLSYLGYAGRPGEAPYDRYYVMGDRSRQYLADRGVDRDRIVVSGIPRFRSHFERAGTWPTEALPENRPTLLYIVSAFKTHGRPVLHRRQNEQIRRIVAAADGCRDPRCRLCIKLHPRGEKADFAWLEDTPAWVTVLDGPVDIFELFYRSHLLTSIVSTMSYEAAIVGCPVALSVFPDLLEVRPRAIHGDFPLAESPEELLDRLYRLHRDPRGERCQYPGADEIADVMHPGTAGAAAAIAGDIAERARL